MNSQNLPAKILADSRNLYQVIALAQRDNSIFDCGLGWYSSAHVDCIGLADSLNRENVFVSLENISKMVAVISPSRYWAKNVIDAKWAILAWAKFTSLEDRKTFCLAHSVGVPYGWAGFVKGWAILDGLAELEYKGSPKTYSFAHNILYPHTSLEVTIDQHMARILAGGTWAENRGNLRISKRQYKQFAEVTIDVAENLGLLPSQVQAIAWEYRQRAIANRLDSID